MRSDDPNIRASQLDETYSSCIVSSSRGSIQLAFEKKSLLPMLAEGITLSACQNSSQISPIYIIMLPKGHMNHTYVIVFCIVLIAVKTQPLFYIRSTQRSSCDARCINDLVSACPKSSGEQPSSSSKISLVQNFKSAEEKQGAIFASLIGPPTECTTKLRVDPLIKAQKEESLIEQRHSHPKFARGLPG